MFGLMYCNRLQPLVFPNCKRGRDLSIRLCTLLNNAPPIIIRSFSSVYAVDDCNKREKKQKNNSFTVSYLINSCELSPESAVSVAKVVNFMSPERPDSVLSLLRDHGFTNAHISKIVKKQPSLLLANPEKTLLPKLEFLCSIGVLKSDLAKIVCWNPTLLSRSLQKHIVPCYNVIKTLTSAGIAPKVAQILKLSSWIFLHNLQNNVVPNVSVLRGYGVPQSTISMLVTCSPSVVALKADKFDERVKQVIQMGFDPSTATFAHALQAITQMSTSTWERKMEVYRRWGWSDDEIWLAFKKHPICMKASEEKIMSVVGFLVNKMGWQPSEIARVPSVLCYSMEKRIIPRCSVIRVLLLKGLIKEEVPVSSVLTSPVQCFLDRFVTKYQDEVPQLLNIFQGKLGLLELGFAFEQTSLRK